MTLDQCTKNYDHMNLGHGDMAWDKQISYFGPNFALYLYRGSKDFKKFSKKNSKNKKSN